MKIKYNKLSRRILTFCLSSVILTGGLTSLATGAGDVKVTKTTEPASGITFEKAVAIDGDKTRNINKITFSNSDSDYMVMPYFGDNLTSRHTLTDMAKLAEEEGYDVVAGVNGDFFYIEGKVSNGMPKGPMIQNDVVIATEDFPPNISAISSQDWQTIGFKRDGTAVNGHFTTKKTMTLVQKDGAITETNFSVMNRQFLQMGIHVYTSAFGDSISYDKGIYGAVLSVKQGDFSLSETVVLKVEKIIDNETEVSIEPGQVIVCAPNTFLNSDNVKTMKSLFEGQRIDLTIAPTDESWNNVYQAISGPNSVVNDGEITTQVSAIPLNYPSSLAGVTADGNIILSQIDGRNMGGSYGIGTIGSGEYMKSLGCNNALLFDGGGSSEIVVKDGDEFKVENLPSDGNERKIGTALLIVKKTDAFKNPSEILKAPEYKPDFWYAYGMYIYIGSGVILLTVVVTIVLVILKKRRKVNSISE